MTRTLSVSHLAIVVIVVLSNCCAIANGRVFNRTGVLWNSLSELQLQALRTTTDNDSGNKSAFQRQTVSTTEESFIDDTLLVDRSQFSPVTSNTQQHQRPASSKPNYIDIDVDRINQHVFPPSINFTALDSKENFINVTWENSWLETKLSIQTLRRLRLIFICNASYPIEWLSERSFDTNDWSMDEIRYFDRSKNAYIFTIRLTLVYERMGSLSFLPDRQEIYCGTPRKSGSRDRRQTMIELSRRNNASSSLKFKVYRDIVANINEEKVQYSDGFGANVDCHVELLWTESRNKFECITNSRSSGLTIDYEENCYDFASCEKRWMPSTCWSAGSRENSQRKSKNATAIWEQSKQPPYGIVYCRKDSQPNNKTAALPFFHSLGPVCHDDDPSTRLKLYVNSGIPDERTLTRDFVSFCESSKSLSSSTSNDATENENEPNSYYVGDNVTVICVASLYHFAQGTRLGYLTRFNSFIGEAVLAESSLQADRERGIYNYTAKVALRKIDITGLVCENFMKQSASSVRKEIRFKVKEPTKIKFKEIAEGIPEELAYWNYTGESGLELRCEIVEGDPLPSIGWRKLGKPVPEDLMEVSESDTVSILRFPSLSEKYFSVEELQGVYSCEAISRLERAEKIFRVNAPNGPNIQIIVPSAKESSSGEGSSTWYIWAIIVPIFLIIVLAVIALLVWKIKRQSRELRLLSKAEVEEFIFGKPEFLQHHSSNEEVNNYAPYLPYNKGYEIAKDQLQIEENAVLGSGAYAIVLKGAVCQKNGDRVKVAIKTAKPLDDVSYFKALLSELKIMGFIGTHPHIVNLVGAVTSNIQNREIFIAIEYCDNGNLLAYLRDNRHRFTNMVTKDGEMIPDLEIPSDSVVNSITSLTLMIWALQIADGMVFLSSKKLIHGDLAARNILLALTENVLTVKISDFGLSRQLFDYGSYIKKQQSPLPWKWLALECLQDMRFSVKSDVWAYSILLYEVFSLGHVPYPGHSYNDEFLDALISGKRPNKPAYASNDIYELMSTCWKENSDERPTFSQIRDFFRKKLSSLVSQDYLDLHEKAVAPKLPNLGSTTAEVYPAPPSAKSEESGIGNSLGKQFRFSLNAKNLTAVFHRN